MAGYNLAAGIPIQVRGFPLQVNILAAADGFQRPLDALGRGGKARSRRIADNVQSVPNGNALVRAGVFGRHHQGHRPVIAFPHIGAVRLLPVCGGIVRFPMPLGLGYMPGDGRDPFSPVQQFRPLLQERQGTQVGNQQKLVKMPVFRHFRQHRRSLTFHGQHNQSRRIAGRNLMQLLGKALFIRVQGYFGNLAVKMGLENRRQVMPPKVIPMHQGHMVETLRRRQGRQALPLGRIGKRNPMNKPVILNVSHRGGRGLAHKGYLMRHRHRLRQQLHMAAVRRPQKGMNAQLDQLPGPGHHHGARHRTAAARHIPPEMVLYRLPENAAGGIDLLDRQQNGFDNRPVAAALSRNAVNILVKLPEQNKPQAERLRRRRRGGRGRRRRGGRGRRRRRRRGRSGRRTGRQQPGQ